MRELSCEKVRQAVPEMALGVLVGSERSVMLAHLETCARCREELRRYSAAADAVLQLTPQSDPPPGFEVRLLERRAADAKSGRRAGAATSPERRRQSLRRSMLAAAAAVVLGAGVALGSLAFSSARAPMPDMRTATLSYEGASYGAVTVVAGRSGWLFMTLEAPGWSGWVRCVVGERGGREMTVGRFLLDDGSGGWAARLPMPAADISSASIETMQGTMIARANIPA
jgi:hypothetical protein